MSDPVTAAALIGNAAKIGGVLKTVVGTAAAVKSLTDKPPKPSRPAVMPTPDDDSIMQTRRRQVAAMQQRSGRASTILSSEEKLGG